MPKMTGITRWLVAMVLVAMAAPGWPSRSLSATSFAASAARAGAAETPLGPRPGELAEAVEVTVVNIDVVVRDRTGRQLAGLTRDDFALFVDGKKTEITNFSGPAGGGASALGTAPGLRAEAPAAPASGGAAVAGGDGAAGSDASTGIAAGASAGVAGGRQRLNLVICVDSFNLQQFRRNRLLEQVAIRDDVAHVSSTLSEEIDVAGHASDGSGRAAVTRLSQPGWR